jgi:hypothetical protein
VTPALVTSTSCVPEGIFAGLPAIARSTFCGAPKRIQSFWPATLKDLPLASVSTWRIFPVDESVRTSTQQSPRVAASESFAFAATGVLVAAVAVVGRAVAGVWTAGTSGAADWGETATSIPAGAAGGLAVCDDRTAAGGR